MQKINILNINLIAGQTGSARLCKTISEGISEDRFSYHTLAGYNFGNDLKTTGIYKTSQNRWYKNIRYKLGVGLNFLFDIMTPGYINMKFLNNFIFYKEADIIHLHTIEGGYFDWTILPSLSKEKKIVITLHGDRLISGNDTINLFPYKTQYSYKKRKKIFINANITYIGVSKWLTNKLQYDSIMGENKISTIYNGINTGIFRKLHKDTCRKVLGLPQHKKIIISIAGSGTKSNLKGLQFVNKIIKEYTSNEDYMFITLGNYKTKKLSTRYREIGLVDSSTMAKYYNAADSFLYPTLADSFGLVVAESISCGCPVITFNIGGVPEIVQHKKNGYIANYKDYNDLLEGFKWIIENRENLDIKLDEIFSQESMVKKYEQLYQSLV